MLKDRTSLMTSMKIWLGIAAIASVALIIQRANSPVLESCDEESASKDAFCSCSDAYVNLSNSFMLYTFGLIGQFLFRVYHLCGSLPPHGSRRKIKIIYRISTAVSAVLFGSLFIWMMLAHSAYENKCEDKAIHDETH